VLHVHFPASSSSIANRSAWEAGAGMAYPAGSSENRNLLRHRIVKPRRPAQAMVALAGTRGRLPPSWLSNHRHLDENELSEGCFLSPRTAVRVDDHRARQVAAARRRLRLPAVSPRAHAPLAPGTLEGLERRSQKDKDERDKVKIVAAAMDCLDYMKKVREKRKRRREKKLARRKRREERRAQRALNKAQSRESNDETRQEHTREQQELCGEWNGLCIPQHLLDAFEDDELAQHKEVFDTFDMDGGGTIDNDELSCLTSALGIQTCPNLLEQIDRDGDGLLDFGEFLLLMQDVKGRRKTGARQREEKLTVFSAEEMRQHRATFDSFDEDGGGTIDAEELETLATELDIAMSPDLLEEIDQDGDGLLDFGEFLLLMLDVKRKQEEAQRRENERIRAIIEEERGGERTGRNGKKKKKKNKKNKSKKNTKKDQERENKNHHDHRHLNTEPAVDDVKPKPKKKKKGKKKRPPSAESRPLRRFVGFVHEICNMPAAKVNRRTLCMLFYQLLPRTDLECSALKDTIAVMLKTVKLTLDDLYAFADLYYGDQRNNIHVSRAKIGSHVKDVRDVDKKEAFNHTFYGGVQRANTDQLVTKGYFFSVTSRGVIGDNRRNFRAKPSRRVPYFETLNPLHPAKEESQRRAALRHAEPSAPFAMFAAPPPVVLVAPTARAAKGSAVGATKWQRKMRARGSGGDRRGRRLRRHKIPAQRER
jgi:Ca2+-binding EF-hand superfamily protein